MQKPAFDQLSFDNRRLFGIEGTQRYANDTGCHIPLPREPMEEQLGKPKMSPVRFAIGEPGWLELRRRHSPVSNVLGFS